MHTDVVKEITHYCHISPQSCPEIPEGVINYYDFTFVLEGSITYYANKEKIILKKNDACFFKPGTLRSREEGAQPVRYVSFNFLSDADFPFEAHLEKCISRDIKKLISVFPQSHLSCNFHSKEKCRIILSYILLELIDINFSNCKNEHVLKILKYIDEHIREKITLKHISEYVYLSSEYTSYIFKKETGKTLTHYINEQKSLLAKELIINEKMPLSAISEYLGFDNYYYFSRTFKKYIGTSPSQIKTNSRIFKK